MFRITHIKRRIPILLTTLRLLLGPTALGVAWARAPRIVFLPILVIGTLSDILDGILARRFQVSTPRIRRYDSVTDAIYYIFLLAVLWKLSREVLVENLWVIALVALSEATCIAVSLIRFARYPATHTYLAKFYGLSLPAGLLALLVFNASGSVVIAVASTALLANAEIIAIHLIAETPPVDILSIFHLPSRITPSTQ
jgi:phosphatidylserine synthase